MDWEAIPNRSPSPLASEILPEVVRQPSPAIAAPALTTAGRPRRNYRLPARFVDVPPEPLAPAPIQPPAPLRRVLLIVRDRLVTAANSFGIWRDYPRRPTVDPSSTLTLEELSNSYRSTATDRIQPTSAVTTPDRPFYWPFSNPTIYRTMSWLNNGGTAKSEGELTSFVQNVIHAPDFSQEHLVGFDAHRENVRFDKAVTESNLKSQFVESPVDILIPSGSASVEPKLFTVPGLLRRSLTATIADAFNDPLAHLLHFSPFKLYRRNPTTQKEERVHGELYTSDAFLAEHEKVQKYGKLPADDPDCKREKVVAALMFSSDATHLTDFGNAKAWPIYLMLGNLSKYTRSLPNSGAMHHLAYIPSLPDSFHEMASAFHARWRTQKAEILTHCRRELMHAVWREILDDEFIHAYTYGMVIKCIDGIECRIYPRIFTYSADYPEKVLLATIRDKGLCPCPRCLVAKSSLDALGMRRDITLRINNFRKYMSDMVLAARRSIYTLGLGVGSSAVDNLLKVFSGVPTINSFPDRLGDDFNPSQMLVVDLLHEFEIGVWKGLFTHLIRILHAAPRRDGIDDLIVELDQRYRKISTFGHGTIRKFAANSSEMKKLAARDFEDLLQCAIPCFEGLLDEPHNRRLMKLLYRTAEWHALAKLRMHTDPTIELLEELTVVFGKLMREFRDLTCSEFATIELPREVAARARRQAAQQAAMSSTSTPPDECAPAVPAPASSSRKNKGLNLFTVKFHFLGDYVAHIRRFGTTDSYSTQLGELAHRLVKRLYGLTNKRDAIKQIGKKYTRQQVFRQAEKKEEDEANQPERLSEHHIISHSRNAPVDIFSFAQDGDPAKKLQDHLLGRILGREFDGDTDEGFTHEDRNAVRFRNSTMFRHLTARINYTTYDIRRDYDTINPRTHPFVMVASPEIKSDPSAHPFWYAQVLGVFHADVQHTGPNSTNMAWKSMDFLWVRWLGMEPGRSFGRKEAKLPKLGFVPETDDYAFGFLDPGLVLRGCHLIPAFNDGRTSDLLLTQSPTEARAVGEIDDWVNYYVGIFVDRDMYMRFLGMGIGHQENTAASFLQVDTPDPDSIVTDALGTAREMTQGGNEEEGEDGEDEESGSESGDVEGVDSDDDSDSGFNDL
ncbi:hypothetical protein BDN70DRAFT_814828 [Pholiota conissans]|uniref:Uncharacterized protein n=1 Tax=Pholiota conissans TaxID=109636 RepID=A0A9P5YTS1_9AGAR|nr:hypothetical protein BDN70DRAFT_814828 [Pholiota conissans]